MSIKIEGVSKDYSGFEALQSVDLTVGEGELVALLGSSGCGKTTLLRIIAGLIQPTKGRIYINGKDITGWPAQKRNTAMVFQNYALFPHMTLEENVAYGLKIRRMGKKEIANQVKEALDQVELGGLNHRKIQELSGGQKQRAALARALVTKPDILLFDEPLSNLDEKLRVSMRKEIRRIQQATGITSVYVTHDQKEAMAIADRIAVMDQGDIAQIGKPEDIFYRPVNTFTADFMGRVNVFECERDNHGRVIFLNRSLETDKSAAHILLPPEEVRVSDKEMGAEAVPGIVVDREWHGAVVRYQLKVMNKLIFADRLSRAKDNVHQPGDSIWIDFDEEVFHAF